MRYGPSPNDIVLLPSPIRIQIVHLRLIWYDPGPKGLEVRARVGGCCVCLCCSSCLQGRRNRGRRCAPIPEHLGYMCPCPTGVRYDATTAPALWTCAAAQIRAPLPCPPTATTAR